jgi:hypothetical protein
MSIFVCGRTGLSFEEAAPSDLGDINTVLCVKCVVNLELSSLLSALDGAWLFLSFIRDWFLMPLGLADDNQPFMFFMPPSFPPAFLFPCLLRQ